MSNVQFSYQNVTTTQAPTESALLRLESSGFRLFVFRVQFPLSALQSVHQTGSSSSVKESLKATLWQKGKKCSWPVSSVHGHKMEVCFVLTSWLYSLGKEEGTKREKPSTVQHYKRGQEKEKRRYLFHFGHTLTYVTFHISAEVQNSHLKLTFKRPKYLFSVVTQIW